MSKNFEALMTIVDKMSKPLLEMEEKLEKFAHVGEKAQAAIQPRPHLQLWNHLGHHLSETGEKFGELKKVAGEFGEKITELLPMLGGIGAAGSVAGIVELAHHFAEATDELRQTAAMAGVTTQQMQALNYVADQMGMSATDLDEGMGRLNERLGKAANGNDKQTAAMFAQIGISMRDASGHVRSAADVLPAFATAIQHTTSPAMRARMVMQAFGRAGLEMLPALEQGGAALQALEAKFKHFGYTVSDEDLQKGLEFNDAWKDLETAVSGLSLDVGAKLVPVLTPLVDKLAEWVAADRDLIATDVQKTLVSIEKALSAIDFNKVLADAEAFGKGLWDLAQDVGGLKTVMMVAAGVMAAPMIASLLSIGRAFVSLSAVMLANPVLTGIVIGAAAVAYSAYFIYEHWKSFAPFFKAVLAAAELPFKVFWAGLKADAKLIAGIVGLFTHPWRDLPREFERILHDAEAPFLTFETKVMGVINRLGSGLETINHFFGGKDHIQNVPVSAAHPAGNYSPMVTRFGPVRLPQPAGLPPASAAPLIDRSRAALHTVHNAVQGSIQATVDFKNVPRGTTVKTKGTGIAAAPKVNLGYSSMAGMGI